MRGSRHCPARPAPAPLSPLSGVIKERRARQGAISHFAPRCLTGHAEFTSRCPGSTQLAARVEVWLGVPLRSAVHSRRAARALSVQSAWQRARDSSVCAPQPLAGQFSLARLAFASAFADLHSRFGDRGTEVLQCCATDVTKGASARRRVASCFACLVYCSPAIAVAYGPLARAGPFDAGQGAARRNTMYCYAPRDASAAKCFADERAGGQAEVGP